jgi:hypothetical protein
MLAPLAEICRDKLKPPWPERQQPRAPPPTTASTCTRPPLAQLAGRRHARPSQPPPKRTAAKGAAAPHRAPSRRGMEGPPPLAPRGLFPAAHVGIGKGGTGGRGGLGRETRVRPWSRRATQSESGRCVFPGTDILKGHKKISTKLCISC